MLWASAILASSAVTMNVTSGKGLEVSIGGVPAIQGSYFQFAEPDWSRGYYSSQYESQTVRELSPAQFEVVFQGANGRAAGKQTYSLDSNRLKIAYEFRWTGERPVIVELCSAFLWAKAFEAGAATAGGDSMSLAKRAFRSAEIVERTVGANAQEIRLSAPWGTLVIGDLGPGWTLFDARNGYPQEWARTRETLWLGALRIPLGPNESWKEEITLTFDEPERASQGSEKLQGLVRPLADAVVAQEATAPLLPKPKLVALNYERTAVCEFRPIVNAFDRDAVRRVDAFASRKLPPSRRLYSIPIFQSFPKEAVEPGLSPEVQAQSFEIRIQREPEGNARIEIDYGGEEGLRHAVSTLAQLIFLRNGEATLPTGRVRDWPSVAWRGVHLFVGPQALEFHEKLIQNVLVPLKFNHVVLQCERTNWESAPGIATPITMPRDDLVKLFALYRRYRIEPIPLIQSFGHMEWLFANGQNLDLALNRAVPYSLDPRKPEAQAMIASIWKEADRLLKPKIFHFGLDEADMRGWPDDPNLVTDLWERQLGFLNGLADEMKREPMIWGDMGLAPGEAIDAGLGDSAEHAARRRKAIRPGSWIADWHYKADPNPDGFRRSLQLWKQEGFRPVAAMWFRPENIRGFTLAAIAEGAGTLQTTWAGYESNETNMVREVKQFSAMVLAADYAWSGRQETPDALGYDPLNVLRQHYFDIPEFDRRDGFAITLPGHSTEDIRYGSIFVRKYSVPVQLVSRISAAASSAPASVEIDLAGTQAARRFWFAIGALASASEGEPVGEIELHWRVGTEVRRQTKRIFYGRQVRADGDPVSTSLVPSFRGIALVPVEFQGNETLATPIKIVFKASDATTGLRLYGVTGV